MFTRIVQAVNEPAIDRLMPAMPVPLVPIEPHDGPRPVVAWPRHMRRNAMNNVHF
jgi:hypothetical protein